MDTANDDSGAGLTIDNRIFVNVPIMLYWEFRFNLDDFDANYFDVKVR